METRWTEPSPPNYSRAELLARDGESRTFPKVPGIERLPKPLRKSSQGGITQLVPSVSPGEWRTQENQAHVAHVRTRAASARCKAHATGFFTSGKALAHPADVAEIKAREAQGGADLRLPAPTDTQLADRSNRKTLRRLVKLLETLPADDPNRGQLQAAILAGQAALGSNIGK